MDSKLTFNSLPLDIIGKVCLILDYRDRLHLSYTCKGYYKRYTTHLKIVTNEQLSKINPKDYPYLMAVSFVNVIRLTDNSIFRSPYIRKVAIRNSKGSRDKRHMKCISGLAATHLVLTGKIVSTNDLPPHLEVLRLINCKLRIDKGGGKCIDKLCLEDDTIIHISSRCNITLRRVIIKFCQSYRTIRDRLTVWFPDTDVTIEP